jgi:photosystem II stability/assembly factor-like uncharacterized protein
MPIRLILVLIVFVLVFLDTASIDTEHESSASGLDDAEDNEWFMLQRTFPYADLDPARYYEARRSIEARRQYRSPGSIDIPWSSVGPSNIGGRISSLALHPTIPEIIYAGAAAGGVWKSTDGGTTWANTFNESPAIGSLSLDPTNPDILYVGTGEANPAGVATYPGNGIWRSTNSGVDWANLGLENTGYIGRIAIHESMPDRIFAAALGLYRSRTEDRGIYRSTDSGTTWERVVFINDTTGACDVVIDPSNPDRIYAATWTRYRPLTYSIISGTGSGLWLSTDGGDAWTQVTSGFPSNDATLGRTSLAVSLSQPNILYALATNGVSPRGIYKSSDSGTSWTLVAGSSPFGGEGQVWFNNVIAVHPADPNTVLAGMTDMYRSTNGGTSWSSVLGSMHVDQHAIEFDRVTPSRIVTGNDGGVFISTNTGLSWIKFYNLPVSQFYAGTIDFTNPQRLFGGTQDNGTLRTLTGSVDDWSLIYGGDGFYVLVDPTNPNRIYAESQFGGLGYSTNGGASFLNGRTSGFGTGDRTNWSTPIAMDITAPLTLYVGTYRIFKTINGMQSWTSISGDLTRGPNGRIGTIATIDVSQSDPSVIYVGTDDAKVSVTQDGGTTWTDVTASLPVRWVTRVTIDPDSANVAFVTQSGYLEDEYSSHIHKTTDFGVTWQDISGNLPDMPVNDIIVDPEVRPYLYIATDAGVMYTSNGGSTWEVLGTDFPTVPVHDLTFHAPTRTLLASTHGRSSYTIDLSSFVSVSTPAALLPSGFGLEQNFPNPFNPSTTIRFSLPEGDPIEVKLVIVDVVGKHVSTLVEGQLPGGGHEVTWNAAGVASGTYFYKLSTSTGSVTRKLVVAK